MFKEVHATEHLNVLYIEHQENTHWDCSTWNKTIYVDYTNEWVHMALTALNSIAGLLCG